MDAPVVTMKQLLEAGVHFGHQTRRWNPKMRRFIFGERNGIYIIDLQQTLARIETAYSFVRDLVADGGNILFIGTKKQAQDPIQSYADKCGMPYINERWLGGMLTNFETIAKRVQKMQEYQRMRTAGDFEAMPKKEALLIGRELEKLERNLKGIREMTKLPEAVFILDTKKEHIGVTEANKLGIPIVAVVDTNCDPDLIQYVIPGNDDAIRAGTLMCRVIADAVEEGRLMASKRGGGAAAPAAPAVRTAEDDARIAAQQAEARRQAALQAQEREARLAATLTEPEAAPEPEAASEPAPAPEVASEPEPEPEAAATEPVVEAVVEPEVAPAVAATEETDATPRSRSSNGRVRRKGREGAARRDRRRDDGREARWKRTTATWKSRPSGCASRASPSPPPAPTARTAKVRSRSLRGRTWPRSSSSRARPTSPRSRRRSPSSCRSWPTRCWPTARERSTLQGRGRRPQAHHEGEHRGRQRRARRGRSGERVGHVLASPGRSRCQRGDHRARGRLR